MAEQLTLLAELAERPNVQLRVLSLGSEQVGYLQHPCMVFEFGSTGQREALMETVTQDVRVTDTAGVNLLGRTFELLSSSSMTPTESLTLIRTAAKSYMDSRD